jgi:hypothetical protein
VRVSVRSALRMRKVAVFGLGTLLILLAGQASAVEAKVRGPWPLVSVAELGTVTWRCDPSKHPGLAHGLPALALGFHSSAPQSGGIRLRADGRTIVTRAIPTGKTITFPYLHTRVQNLAIWEGGEDGTLRAFVRVDFAARATSGYCWAYMPPKTEVRLLPRR